MILTLLLRNVACHAHPLLEAGRLSCRVAPLFNRGPNSPAKKHGKTKCTRGLYVACRYVAFRVPCLKPAKEDSKGGVSPTRLMVHNRRRNSEATNPEWVGTAHTFLLEVSGDLWKGGGAAEKLVAVKIATALAPHRKANAPHLEPHDCFSLIRCSSCESSQPSFRPFSL